MALANQIGLSEKVVSERHYYASLYKLTAGEAAQRITKETKKKISAKDVRVLYKLQFSKNMEWHHSGFYDGKHGKQMGRTFFISSDDLNIIIKNIDTLLEMMVETVYAYQWEGRRVLKAFHGRRSDLPEDAIVCDLKTYEAAKKWEGHVYNGWDDPKELDESIYAFYFVWEKDGRSRWLKILNTFHGIKADSPSRHITVCSSSIYEAANKATGRVYTGWDEPQVTDFK